MDGSTRHSSIYRDVRRVVRLVTRREQATLSKRSHRRQLQKLRAIGPAWCIAEIDCAQLAKSQDPSSSRAQAGCLALAPSRGVHGEPGRLGVNGLNDAQGRGREAHRTAPPPTSPASKH